MRGRISIRLSVLFCFLSTVACNSSVEERSTNQRDMGKIEQKNAVEPKNITDTPEKDRGIAHAPNSADIKPESKDVASPPTQISTSDTLKNSISPNKENDILFCHGDRQCPLKNMTLQAYAKTGVDIKLPASNYWYIWERQGEVVSPLKDFWSTGEAMSNLHIELTRFQKDTDWFFVSTSLPMTNQEQDKIVDLLSISQAVKQPPMGTVWQLFGMEANGDKQRILGKVNIYQTPFALHMKIKSKGSNSFENFQPGAQVNENDAMQIAVKTYQPTSLAIFLYNSPSKITQVFPSEGIQKASLFAQNTTCLIPAQGEFIFDRAEEKEYLVCFYSNREMDCQQLVEWLQTTPVQNLSEFTVMQRGYELTSEEEEEEPAAESILQKPKARPASLFIIQLEHQK